MMPSIRVAYPRGVGQRAAINTGSTQLHRAIAQVAELQRALESRQQASIAAQRQVENPTDANVHLKVLADQCEHAVTQSASRHSTSKATDFFSSAELDQNATPELMRLLTQRTGFRKDDVLYRAGDRFNALYAIRVDSCNTVLLASDGQDQVAGFHMAGEIIGIDGIATDVHECEAIVLEGMEVCRLPFDQIERLAKLSDEFGHTLHKLLLQESTRIHSLMIVLGTMRAEQRRAVFLLDLSQRYRARGYSPSEFVLRMTREECGSYLGLKPETVSRLFSRFRHECLLQALGRNAKLLDRVALSQPVGYCA
ncbi:MAG TPA: helix-turn-helix domain-containing protein [Casimicrobiaceae bacterium]|nr:helix-turn-helix domain-containing protein [Casimicrobiaceae bacterium]